MATHTQHLINQPLDTQALPDVFQRIHDEVITAYGQGAVADYIPSLKEVDPNQFVLAQQRRVFLFKVFPNFLR